MARLWEGKKRSCARRYSTILAQSVEYVALEVAALSLLTKACTLVLDEPSGSD